jgi:hypothetical protein
MMAGYKLFATGDVLTAAQVNTFLMRQTTMVFADSAARATALTGVLTEGMLTYLTDTNSLEYYDGAAFQPVSNPGDITGVTAGTGLSGGGASGDVTITNAMATAIDAKGDLIPGTGADTFGRLVAGANETRLVADSSETTGLKYVADTTNFAIAAKGDLLAGTAADTLAALAVGANGTVLTADSTETTGLKWVAPTSGSMTLLNSGSTNLAGLSGTVTFSSLSGSYKDLAVRLYGANPSSASAELVLRFNADSGTNYPREEYAFIATVNTPAFFSQNSTGIDLSAFGRSFLDQSANNFWDIEIPNYTLTGYRVVNLTDTQNLGGNVRVASGAAGYKGTAAITSLSIILTAGSWTTGTIEIYGVN